VPRRPDPDLEGEILDAARKLWKKGGEHALTMRTVAKAAGTNTPAVYRRFRHRDDILRALLQRIRLEVVEILEGASSVEESCDRYVDYAVSHPHEYELFFQKEYELFRSSRSKRAGVKPVKRAGIEAMKRKLAEELGGTPEDYERLYVGLWMLGHGAATLLISNMISPEDRETARAVMRTSVATLLREARRAQPTPGG